MDSGLLSLGRAVMGEWRRLGHVPEWRSYGNATVVLRVSPSDEPLGGLPPGMDRRSPWRMGGRGSSVTSLTNWRTSIAYVFCLPPARAFVRDQDRLYAGLPPASPPVPPGSRDCTSSVNGEPLSTGTRGSSTAGRLTWWYFYGRLRRNLAQEAIDIVDLGLSNGTLLERPCWLAGVGSRELNADSHEEVFLARRLGTSAWSVNARHPLVASQPQDRGNPYRCGPCSYTIKTSTDSTTALSRDDDRPLFGVERSKPPADDGSVLLADIVVFPGLVALVVMLVSTSV